MKFKVTFKESARYGIIIKAPEIYETYCRNTSDAFEEYCKRYYINPSEIQEFKPLVVSTSGPGYNGEGYYESNNSSDKPASAFKIHTMHPKKYIGTLWKDSNNPFLDYIYKITNVWGDAYPDPFDTTKYEIEYVILNPRTMQIQKGDFFGIIDLSHWGRFSLALFGDKENRPQWTTKAKPLPNSIRKEIR